jgi:hypothetical protein
MDSTTTTSTEVKTQSVYIPANWKKNQEQKAMGYLNWMAYTVRSVKYIDDQKTSDALLTFNN